MRKWLILAAAALQVLVLAAMAIEREWVVATGRTIHLRTAPIDPRDPFRGDYVRLSYEISTIPRERLRDGLTKQNVPRDARLFAVLELDENGLAQLQYATDRRPEADLFIRGRVHERTDWGAQVRYGLEAYFVQQGKGLDLERLRDREGGQVPLEMEVAVGGNGLAVLKGYRWAKLGLGLRLEGEPLPAAPRGRRRASGVAKLSLLNASEEPLAVVDLPAGRSFALESTLTSQRKWTWAGADAPRPEVRDSHVHLLQPGQVHDVTIDLDDPLWEVVGEDGKRVFLRDLAWGDWFRLVYRPPSEADCRRLRDAEKIWHGRLPSRAFNGLFSID